MVRQDVPVLIVGGSLVGLSTALLLGHHGVRALVVEHHRGTAIHPRAAQVSQRTMEILREVGLEQVVRARSSERFVQDGAIVAVESLAGRELAQFIANLNEGVRDVSPTERIFLSQNLLEPLLEARAAELGAEIRFSTDMVSFEQDADGVTASIRSRNSETTETVRATYLVAADGAHSSVRARLGIPTHGRGTFSHSVTIYFRGNVAPLLRGRNLSVIYVNHPELRGFFRFEQPFDRGFLAINALGDPASPQSDVATGLTEDRCAELVRTALGSSDVAVEIENVMPWDAEANVAARMQDARIFLAGDAAHVMPPNGGFGGNTGVQDAHNLAWKLAYVLAGSADVALLDTYGAERQPVGTFTTEQAYSRYVTRTAPYLGTAGIQPVANDLEIELGYAYASPAICLEPGSNPPHGDPRQSRARPGTRAPHIWIESDGQQVSTLDLFGRSFVLLAGHDGGAWCQAGRDASRRMGVPLDVYRVGTDGRLHPESPGSRTAAFGRNERGGRQSNAVPVPLTFTEAYGLSSTGAVIVRPDGFCGWRAVEIQRGGESERSAELERALERLLCRRPHEAG